MAYCQTECPCTMQGSANELGKSKKRLLREGHQGRIAATLPVLEAHKIPNAVTNLKEMLF